MLKKTLAVMIAAVMLLTVVPFSFASGNDVDYTINSPYEGVDFSTYNRYKADLHSHTTFSDGGNSLPEMVERHYELGFDILAISDHGTVSYGYTTQRHNEPMLVFSLIDNGEYVGDVLSANGVAANGNQYTVSNKGTDEFYSQKLPDGKNGQEMLRVPYANEQNPTSFNNAHVNSWFVDYGHGVVGGTSNYISPISKIDELGGLCVINHPGEYTNARDEENTADAYNLENSTYEYKINKFINVLNTYDACIGIDINSKGDSRTRYDRKLWDILLQKILPVGERNVFAIATSDAHNLDIVDSGYTVMLMPELTSDNLRTSLANGQFFAASKYLGNYDEQVKYKASLEEIGTADALELAGILGNAIDANDKFNATDYPDAAAPVISNITVDEAEDTITLATENALVTHWIADGKVIHVGNTIDLDDYSDKIGKYVRAESLGKGGIIYTQAFVLDYEGAPVAEKDGFFFDWGTIASALCDIPVKILVAILKTPIRVIFDILA
ncbi:MAG: PHP domain-containing protein [Acutalibacteraceae bacterium]|nr:PHP domain-containing protein [Acutalibacteraceae bacterium]